MSDLNGVQTDIEWIKKTLEKIEAAVDAIPNYVDTRVGVVHRRVDKILIWALGVGGTAIVGLVILILKK